jgi:hypothetical protein
MEIGNSPPAKNTNNTQWIVIGANLLIMVMYNLYFGSQPDHMVIIVVAILIGLHAVICLIMAIFVWRKAFLLSALLVLLIGFSTCLLTFS